jgi:hypothetical protein
MDFLSIAMAVTAADIFVLRDASFNRWNREFDIVLPLAEPARWQTVQHDLESALLFLSGDTWRFTFEPGGAWPASRRTPPASLSPRRDFQIGIGGDGIAELAVLELPCVFPQSRRNYALIRLSPF